MVRLEEEKTLTEIIQFHTPCTYALINFASSGKDEPSYLIQG